MCIRDRYYHHAWNTIPGSSDASLCSSIPDTTCHIMYAVSHHSSNVTSSCIIYNISYNVHLTKGIMQGSSSTSSPSSRIVSYSCQDVSNRSWLINHTSTRHQVRVSDITLDNISYQEYHTSYTTPYTMFILFS